MKLHIPGPISISPDTWDAMSAPMIGHRSGDFQKLYEGLHPAAQRLFGTQRPVYLATSSAWGVMEAALNNLCEPGDRVLTCCQGAFSDKWADVARRGGYEAIELKKAWGSAFSGDDLREVLAEHEDIRVVTLIHSETSTGVLNPLAEIAAAVREAAPQALLVVDTVSSASTVPLEMDAWDIDVLLTGSQKALALPPGLALFSVSQRGMDRAAVVENRGYYFDFLEFQANFEKWMTPSTPCIHTIRGLAHQLRKMEAEGWEARFARHSRLNGLVADWVTRHGFAFFAPQGARSQALTCIDNNQGIDVAALAAGMKSHQGIVIDQGYGKLKGQAFRLSNMGDETDETIQHLVRALDEELARLD